MPVAITTFRNVRTRIQRASNDAWVSGWVTHLVREEARVRLWSDVPFAANEGIACACYGQGSIARFQGTVFAQSGQDIAVAINGSILYAPSEETPRICAVGITGTLESEGKSTTLMVLDVSPLSLGALADAGFSPGAQLTISLPTDTGPIAAKVSVANCRQDMDDPSQYRIGFHILEMSRLDRARWGRLIAEQAEA